MLLRSLPLTSTPSKRYVGHIYVTTSLVSLIVLRWYTLCSAHSCRDRPQGRGSAPNDVRQKRGADT
ncbi:uncharacterized protein BDV17DRAFT_251657 [Aspergillus undulatus]|uniref:uncharacterized protein n=1 Tax=Aspergillus undulatus TaxID=1810928 RepID=UPI003CCD6A44